MHGACQSDFFAVYADDASDASYVDTQKVALPHLSQRGASPLAFFQGLSAHRQSSSTATWQPAASPQMSFCTISCAAGQHVGAVRGASWTGSAAHTDVKQDDSQQHASLACCGAPAPAWQPGVVHHSPVRQCHHAKHQDDHQPVEGGGLRKETLHDAVETREMSHTHRPSSRRKRQNLKQSCTGGWAAQRGQLLAASLLNHEALVFTMLSVHAGDFIIDCPRCHQSSTLC